MFCTWKYSTKTLFLRCSPLLVGENFNYKYPRWSSNIANPRGRLLHYAVLRNDSLTGSTPDVLDFFIGEIHTISVLKCDYKPGLSYPVNLTLNITFVYRESSSLLLKIRKYEFITDSNTNLELYNTCTVGTTKSYIEILKNNDNSSLRNIPISYLLGVKLHCHTE